MVDVRLQPDGRWAALKHYAFTKAILVGHVGDDINVDDRWCYGTHEKAKTALDAWDGTGEPAGWHRHPNTGRRVAQSDDERDNRGRKLKTGQPYVSM